MKRLVMMAVAAGAALTAAAMPTKAELQKAQEMVADVTEADVKALKAGTMKPAEVAAKHMDLATQAGSEAEKYLLLQAAFKLYAKAGDYEGAANALGTMNREIVDMNPEVIVSIYNKAIFSSMKEKAPKLHAIKEAARRLVSYRKQLVKAEAAAKANPKDTVVQKKLGECHAELGNWPKALDAFVLAGGDLAKAAKAELDGTAAPQVSGDFWWDYESGDEMSTYKLHAAELYRTALADDSFKGLARTRADQRVKEAEEGEAIFCMKSSNNEASGDTLVVPSVSYKGGETITLTLNGNGKKGVPFDFSACPPGEFVMGSEIPPMGKNLKAKEWWNTKHNVKITYPFLIMQGPLSYSEADALDLETAKKGHAQFYPGTEHIIADSPVMELPWDDIQVLLAKMNEKMRLPPRLRRFAGYEFRLPTEAEWRYAMRGGSDDKDWGAFSDWCKEWAGYWWGKLPKGSYCPFAPVSSMKKTRNPWGLYYLGPKTIYADTFSGEYPKGAHARVRDLCYVGQDIFKYAEKEVNPVRIFRGDDFSYLVFYAGRAPQIAPRDHGGRKTPIRFVFAPKLSLLNVYPHEETTGATNSDACYPREDFGGELLTSKYEIVEHTGRMSYVHHLDRLFNCERAKRSAGDGFAFEVSAKEKEAGFTLALPEPITLAGLLVVNRAEVCKERQVPLCVWASEDRVKWERIFIDESVRDEYRIDLSKKNITCKYLRFGRLPGVNNEPFHLARTLVYVKSSAAGKGGNQPQVAAQSEKKEIQTLPPVKPSGARPADKKFNLAKGIDVEMIGCPAGEFIMGESSRGQEFFPHNVKISRPFWLSKTRVTFEQYETFKKTGTKEKELEKWVVTEALGGRQCPVWGITYEEFLRFCEVLTRKYKGKIPKGYVFRPPTEAEWEYAYRTDATDENDPHCWQTSHQRLDQLPLFRSKKVQELADSKVKAMGIDVFKMPDYFFPSPKVGTQPPNKWGICDLLDFGNELTFDTIDRSKNVNSKGGWHWHLINPNNQVFHYEPSETDPLKVFASKGGADAVTRYGMVWKFESVARWFVCRLCLGPDLVAEKKAKGK